MPDNNNLGFFVLLADVFSGLSPMIEMEINFYHVFNILYFLIVSHSKVTLKFTTSVFCTKSELNLRSTLIYVVCNSVIFG